MNKTHEILLIFISLLILNACEEKSIIRNELESLGINNADFFKIDTTFSESKLIEKLRFVKSDKEDIRISFYESGKKKSFIPTKNSQVHGKCTDWYENGQIKWNRFYDAGNSIKQSVTYDENGNRTKIDDFIDGSFTEFYDNDKPLFKRSDKMYIDYYINGQIKSSFVKENDSLTKVKCFNENGKSVFIGKADSKFALYKNDTLYSGEITCEFLDGQISFNQKYLNGMPDGKTFSKYGNKNMEFELEFKNGTAIGIHKRYFLNGQIQSTKDYDTKEYKEWDKKGNLVE